MTMSVIIPNWNGKHLLKTCLQSLKKQQFKDFEIFIVDNGSNDDSVVYIKKNYPGVKLIQLSTNTGFAYAVNQAIKASHSKFIVLLNNDTKVSYNCLEYLVAAAENHPDVGMIASKMLNYQKTYLIDSAGNYIDSAGHADSIGLGEKDDDKFNQPGYVFLVNGGGCLIKRDVFKKAGLFDEKYFLYMEDIDLSLRAQMAGFKAWYEPKAVIYHKHKTTSSGNKPLMEYFQFRNMMQTIIKDFPKELLYKDFNWLKILLVNFNTFRFLIAKGYFLQALKAEGYILLNFFSLMKTRKKIQSNIKVPVDYIIENIKPKKFTIPDLEI